MVSACLCETGHARRPAPEFLAPHKHLVENVAVLGCCGRALWPVCRGAQVPGLAFLARCRVPGLRRPNILGLSALALFRNADCLFELRTGLSGEHGLCFCNAPWPIAGLGPFVDARQRLAWELGANVQSAQLRAGTQWAPLARFIGSCFGARWFCAHSLVVPLNSRCLIPCSEALL